MNLKIDKAFLLSAFLIIPSVPAQIPFVTARTPRSPGPPMAFLQTNPPPALAAPAPAPLRVFPSPVRAQPSLDKAELDRRVVAFQKQRAADGFSSAQFELGLRYLEGRGVEKDLAIARMWLSLAAKAGEINAQRKLSELQAAPPTGKQSAGP